MLTNPISTTNKSPGCWALTISLLMLLTTAMGQENTPVFLTNGDDPAFIDHFKTRIESTQEESSSVDRFSSVMTWPDQRVSHRTKRLANPISLSASLSTDYSYSVDSTTRRLYEYHYAPDDQDYTALRVQVSSGCASDLNPVMFSVRHQDEILAWTVPFNDNRQSKRILRPKTGTCGKKAYFKTVGRTLCPWHIVNRLYKLNNNNNDEKTVVDVSSMASSSLQYNLRVDVVTDFEIRHNETRSITVASAQPVYYMYTFPDDVDDVVIRLTSNSSLCMTVSVQKIRCPVLDLERNIEFEGNHQTMTKKANLFLERSDYKIANGSSGFYVVLVVHSTDDECTEKVTTTEVTGDRNKFVDIEIFRGLSSKKYTVAIVVTVVVFLSVSILLIIALEFKPIYSFCGFLKNVHTPDGNAQAEGDGTKKVNELSTQTGPNVYCRNLISVSIFYGLPAIQLVVTYHKVLRESGDEDLCFYNFACAHPGGSLRAFNNVFSNIGYVILGICFIIIVWRRKVHHNTQIEKTTGLRDKGIPHDYGFFCAMGFALIMEGVMSGTYHVCPNSFNFQFDTSFMYIMACLCIVKIYQSRHNDVIPKAYKFYLYVGVFILIAVLLLIFGSTFLWVVYAFFHAFCTVVILVQYLYYGEWRICPAVLDDDNPDLKIPKTILSSQDWSHFAPCERIKDHRFYIPVAIGVVNCICAIVIASLQPKAVAFTFLIIFVVNLILYCIFYIFKKAKCCGGQGIVWPVVLLMVATVAMWAISYFLFFKQHLSQWEESPSMSREHNRGCILMEFYDAHDVWHFLSAVSLFLSFMLLLVLDDGVSTVSRNELDVF